jgi:hypothetical protein
VEDWPNTGFVVEGAPPNKFFGWEVWKVGKVDENADLGQSLTGARRGIRSCPSRWLDIGGAIYGILVLRVSEALDQSSPMHCLRKARKWGVAEGSWGKFRRVEDEGVGNVTHYSNVGLQNTFNTTREVYKEWSEW